MTTNCDKEVIEVEDYLHKTLTMSIIGAAFDVFKELGPGFLERAYEGALEIVLNDLGYDVRRQRPLEVNFRGAVVANYFADLIVNDCILIELKHANEVLDIHRIQLLNYLKATGYEVGLVIAFGSNGVMYQRVANTISYYGH